MFVCDILSLSSFRNSFARVIISVTGIKGKLSLASRNTGIFFVDNKDRFGIDELRHHLLDESSYAADLHASKLSYFESRFRQISLFFHDVA